MSDTTRAALLGAACPLCSFLRADHRELCEDVLVFPAITKGRLGGKFRISGCVHMAPVFGPHATQVEAEEILAAHLDRLREQKARASAQIERSAEIAAKARAQMEEKT